MAGRVASFPVRLGNTAGNYPARASHNLPNERVRLVCFDSPYLSSFLRSFGFSLSLLLLPSHRRLDSDAPCSCRDCVTHARGFTREKRESSFVSSCFSLRLSAHCLSVHVPLGEFFWVFAITYLGVTLSFVLLDSHLVPCFRRVIRPRYDQGYERGGVSSVSPLGFHHLFARV